MKKLLLIFMFLLVVSLSGCNSNPNDEYCVEGSVKGVYVCQKTWTSYFDAPISLKLYHEKDSDFSVTDVFEAVETILMTYHRYFDKYNAYPNVTNIFSINHRQTDTVEIDPELLEAIQFALTNENQILVGDEILFNIALGPVLDIWHDARESDACEDLPGYSICPIPDENLLTIDYPTDPNDIVLDEEASTISFLKSLMKLDVGGYAKGYVSELVSDYLDSLDLDYIFNCGESNLKAGGSNPLREDGLFYIGLKEPVIQFIPTSFYAYLKIPEGISIVTSGNYQRYFIGEDDGLVYHHIIDPRTNYPGGESMSVTVFYEDGAKADIYSTAIYLMTIDEGLAFVDNTPGLEAIWYLDDGSTVVSENFESLYLYQYLE
ncbi:MAG: FAD:protein FMN transferase [Bacilli bacterium]|nr:FAD:protein FMN transferase [Bacilli bacterium]